jgi:hypothetical protein
LATLRHDTGAPLEKWAFVHGMWALNGSDRTVCQIDIEMEILMEHGCWGDFTFPAGRRHCDPKLLGQPYTCRPFKAPKAYDDPRGEPIAMDVGAGAIRDDRFLIWNSRAKHNVCSLGCYDASDLSRVKQADQIAFSWLTNCPVIDNVPVHQDRCAFDGGEPLSRRQPRTACVAEYRADFGSAPACLPGG